MAEKLDQKREAELRSDQQAAEALDRAAQQLPKRLEVRKVRRPRQHAPLKVLGCARN